MRYLFLFLGIIFSAFTFSQGEYIEDYDVEIRIDTPNIINVTEKITVQSQGDKIKRGIYRTLPKRRDDKYGKSIPVYYTVENVLRDGNEENFFIRTEGGNKKIYIGNKNVMLDPGRYSYTIQYSSKGQIGLFKGYDELYWNITGNDWDFPIRNVTAKIVTPYSANILQYACYTGVRGSKDQDCRTEVIDSSNIVFTAENLGSGEGLTVGVGFEKGYIQEQIIEDSGGQKGENYVPGFWDIWLTPLLLILAVLVLSIYYFYTWSRFGRDPQKPTVVPQWEPPLGLSPASVGMISKERYYDDLLTAAIVNLATKGYLEIREEEKEAFLGLFKSREFTLVKQKEAGADMSEEEVAIFDEIFEHSDQVKIDGKYDSNIASALTKFKLKINSKHESMIEAGANKRFLIFPILFLCLVTAIIIIYDRGVRMGFIVMIASTFNILMIFGFAYIFLRHLIGRIGRFLLYGFAALILCVATAMYFSISNAPAHTELITISSIIFIVVSTFAYHYLIVKPSKEKLMHQSKIEGFKMYISAAEEKQLQAFNPPEVTPEIFEKLLPYAIALDLEEIWGDKFRDFLLKSSIDPSQYKSSWYTGSRTYTSGFGHELNSAFSNTFSGSATKPSSSSSGGSWSSGSSGGGSSGGGGGGGGGGGW